MIDLPVSIDDALRLRVRAQPEALMGTTVADVDELPEHWYGYDGVDAVVVTAGSSSWLQSASAAQAEALVDWVHWGGRLVLAVGPDAILYHRKAPLDGVRPEPAGRDRSHARRPARPYGVRLGR